MSGMIQYGISEIRKIDKIEYQTDFAGMSDIDNNSNNARYYG